ncbi:hypothetical protein TYRP_020527 [Tyrophagus putrescentiae]|nr:hypothetical protein TYRP_020527 [Tyrophagus putrescentiae]
MAAAVVVGAPVVPEVAAMMATLLPLTAVGHQRSSAGVLLDDHEDDASLLVLDVKVIGELWVIGTRVCGERIFRRKPVKKISEETQNSRDSYDNVGETKKQHCVIRQVAKVAVQPIPHRCIRPHGHIGKEIKDDAKIQCTTTGSSSRIIDGIICGLASTLTSSTEMQSNKVLLAK